MNRNIIIAILAIVVVAAVGFMLFSHPATTDGKLNTQINFLTGTSMQNGDQVQFELKDAQGNAVAGQTVTIAYDDGSGNVQNYKIMTDASGKGYLTISGEDAGTYDITVTFDGNDKYNGCNAKQTITVEDGAADTTPEETESNSTANTVMYNNASSTDSSTGSSTGSEDPSHEFVSQLYYDEDLGVYYDDFGTIHGGDMDGNEIGLLRAMHDNPNTDEYGNSQWGEQ